MEFTLKPTCCFLDPTCLFYYRIIDRENQKRRSWSQNGQCLYVEVYITEVHMFRSSEVILIHQVQSWLRLIGWRSIKMDQSSRKKKCDVLLSFTSLWVVSFGYSMIKLVKIICSYVHNSLFYCIIFIVATRHICILRIIFYVAENRSLCHFIFICN